MNVVAVPVKDLVNAKQRLVGALSPAERMALARAMLHDVLRALAAAHVDARWVVTRDPEVAAIARDFGADVLREELNRGHTAAVAAAQREAARIGARLFATIPGDTPCVTAGEIDTLTTRAAGEAAAVAFAPSRSGVGTNGAALAPPAAMPLTFGEPSFDNHLRAARERGLAPRVLRLPGLGLDVDGPEDLALLMTGGPSTESGRLLARWSIGERLAV
ncbi:MAG TPA: 2-phospho-L-lactate guanylyltransferase [Solirubrobacteraceae bacterium]|jgi:2-phospho-L-lactate guanylyltransferase